jgi:hypothetical protein
MGDDGMPEAAGKLNDTGLWEMPPTGFVPAVCLPHRSGPRIGSSWLVAF